MGVWGPISCGCGRWGRLRDEWLSWSGAAVFGRRNGWGWQQGSDVGVAAVKGRRR